MRSWTEKTIYHVAQLYLQSLSLCLPVLLPQFLKIVAMRTVVQTSLINSGVTQHMRSVSWLVCQTKGEAQIERIMRDFNTSVGSSTAGES